MYIGTVFVSTEVILSPFGDMDDKTLGVVVKDELGTDIALGDVDVVSEPESRDCRYIVAGVARLLAGKFTSDPDTVIE